MARPEARRPLAALEAEADEAYEEFIEKHREAWEAHCRHARVERHRMDVAYATDHPVLAWFQGAARRRMAQFERAMLDDGNAGPWRNAASLERVRALEAHAKAEAKGLWDELFEAEARWERLYGSLEKPGNATGS